MAYTNKTQPTKVSPSALIKSRAKGKDQLQADAETLIALYAKASGSPCVLWGKIFGFGSYTYFDSKGGEHSSLATGFALSSTGFTLYNMMGWASYGDALKQLGAYKLSGKSCLAIKRVSDIDPRVLQSLIKQSLRDMKAKYAVKR